MKRRMFVFISVLLIVVLAAAVCSGCKSTAKFSEDGEVVESGYTVDENESGDPRPPYGCCGIRANKSVSLDVDKIEVEISFGIEEEGIKKYANRKDFCQAQVALYKYRNHDRSVMLEIEAKDIFTDRYTCTVLWEEEPEPGTICVGGRKVVDFNHSEKISFPTAWLDDEEGFICLGFSVWETDKDGHDIGYAYDTQSIKYKVENGVVIFS